MIRFLNKQAEMDVLDQLFDLLYENMRSVTPTGLSYEQEKRQWLSCVRPAMEKDARQIILLFDGGEPAGYCQYYLNGCRLMVEEVQLKGAYRSTSAIVSMMRFLMKQAGEAVFLEAYADSRNLVSRKLMEKLGMECIADEGQFLHYRIPMAEARKRLVEKSIKP